MGSLINVASSLRLVFQRFSILQSARMRERSIFKHEAIHAQVHRLCYRCICAITQINKNMRNQKYRDSTMLQLHFRAAVFFAY